MRKLVLALMIVALSAGIAFGAGIAPAKKDKCPVCGMLVYMYKDWAAKVEFNDGTLVYFDGPKDMFRYWLDLRKYAPGKTQADIRTILVTEYYDLEPMDAKSAFYVLDSNIMGPMGHELVPFKSEAQAKEFMKDHKGKRILRFDDVTAGIMKGIN